MIDRPDVKVLLLDHYDGQPVTVDGVPIQDSGAPIVWYVFPERWYDIGRFHVADETTTGWYTNLCRPPVLDGDHWIGSDLFLDLWQPVEGLPQWLDEDEFEQAVARRLIDAATRRRVLRERALIDLERQERGWPPPIARDIDLARARALSES